MLTEMLRNKKGIKIYKLKVVFLNLYETSDYRVDVNVYTGYFTSLKYLYDLFDPKHIQSYSRIMSKMKKDRKYSAQNVKLKNRKSHDIYSNITIELYISNRLYNQTINSSLPEIFEKELFAI